MGKKSIVVYATAFLFIVSSVLFIFNYFVYGFSIFFHGLYFSTILVINKISSRIDRKIAISYHTSVIGGWVAGMMILLLSQPLPQGEGMLIQISL